MCILFHSSYLLIRAINLENHHAVRFQLCSIPLFLYLRYLWQYILFNKPLRFIYHSHLNLYHHFQNLHDQLECPKFTMQRLCNCGL